MFQMFDSLFVVDTLVNVSFPFVIVGLPLCPFVNFHNHLQLQSEICKKCVWDHRKSVSLLDLDKINIFL